MTKQVRGQLQLLLNDLKHERAALAKAKSYFRYNLPGTKTMVKRHEQGVQKTLSDITKMKARVKRLQSQGKIYKII